MFQTPANGIDESSISGVSSFYKRCRWDPEARRPAYFLELFRIINIVFGKYVIALEYNHNGFRHQPALADWLGTQTSIRLKALLLSSYFRLPNGVPVEVLVGAPFTVAR